MGGGILILLRKDFDVKIENSNTFESFEQVNLRIKLKSTKYLRLIVIYRPQLNALKKPTNNVFITEFASLLENFISDTSHLYICGDFNYHFNNKEDPIAEKFRALLQSFDLVQHVTRPTHDKGNILDLLITRQLENSIQDMDIIYNLPSDHAAVKWSLRLQSALAEKKFVHCRDIKKINIDQFCNDINNSELSRLDESDVNTLVSKYNTCLKTILDRHAPLISREVYVRNNLPWYTDELKLKKRETRSYERRWLKSRLESDKQILKTCCNEYSTMLTEAKNKYFSEKFNVNDSRKMFDQICKFFKTKSSAKLPENGITDKELANMFMKFFFEKITLIQEKITDQNQDIYDIRPPGINVSLLKFEAVSEETMKTIINRSSSATCCLDPIPTILLKRCLPQLLPIITRIVNTSLKSEIFPEALKEARIVPLLKNSSLNQNELKNYRPVANLPFIGKLIERVVVTQIQDYLNTNNLHARTQSAYRKCFSTETALLRVTNDLMRNLDDGVTTVMVLLDYSAAFDTISHEKLFGNLQTWYGIHGGIITWLKSYLLNRVQFVDIKGSFSKKSPTICGVPQGSVLGPLLFTLYASRQINDIAHSFGCSVMIYADDTQIYSEILSAEFDLERIQHCLQAIKTWSTNNCLKLNNDKTIILQISSKSKQKLDIPEIQIGNVTIPYVVKARNLGIIFDSCMCLDKQITKVTQLAFRDIYNLNKVVRLLNRENAHAITHAFITSRLDYCNSIYYGLPDSQLNKLQRVQNAAARLITRLKKRDHVTPALKFLHWLPIKQRIQFKILLITYKTTISNKPTYLRELLKDSELTRSKNLKVTTAKNRYGERAFSRCAPLLWNNLPIDIKLSPTLNLFKKKLKTHLFTQYFNNI